MLLSVTSMGLVRVILDRMRGPLDVKLREEQDGITKGWIADTRLPPSVSSWNSKSIGSPWCI